MNTAIEINGLQKSYGDVKALNMGKVEIKEGEIFGLIGPDGAGKTTLFRILTTLLEPDAGTAKLFGLDVVKDFKELRKHIGYMPERFSLYMDLSVMENLEFFASVFGVKVEDQLPSIQNIWDHISPFSDRRASQLSGGMKQKLALCCALIHRPKVLILDEPTTGVDAVSRLELWGMLADLRDKGMTIVAATPYMNEAAMCDRVALFQKGKILRLDTAEELTKSFEFKLYRVKADHLYPCLLSLRESKLCHSVYAFGQGIHIVLEKGVEANQVILYLTDAGFKSIEVKEITAGMEDCFMEWGESEAEEEVSHG